MLSPNFVAQLWIALNPDSEDDSQYKKLNFVSDLKTNFSVKKQDRNYFHNKGSTTSIITSTAFSLNVSIDYNPFDELHYYLFGLIGADPFKLNNQKIKLIIPNTNQTSTKTSANSTVLTGKAAFSFKNYIPSGAPDEQIKFEFEIFPQDNSFTISHKNVDVSRIETEIQNL